MVDVEPASTAWLIGYLLLSLTAAVAVAAQGAVQHASRPRLRVLAEGGLTAAKPALQVLEEGSRVPTLLVVVILLTTGAAATCLVMATIPLDRLAWWAPAAAILIGALVHLVLCAVGRGIAIARPEATAIRLVRLLVLIRYPVLAMSG